MVLREVTVIKGAHDQHDKGKHRVLWDPHM